MFHKLARNTLLVMIASGCSFAFAQQPPAMTAPMGAPPMPMALPNGAMNNAVPQPVPGAPVPSVEGPALPPPEKLVSFFFNANERDVLAQAKLYYGRQGLGDDDMYDEEDLLDQLNNVKLRGIRKDKQIIRESFYTQFYLESIIYHSPSDWKVRVREDNTSKEFSPYSTGPKEMPLRVLSISREQVTFDWLPINWERITETYKDPSSAIFLDNEEKRVIFSLMVNQTLFSYDMTVREGRMNLIPMVQTDDNAAASLPLADSLPEIFSDDNEDASPAAENAPKMGIPGLLGTYKHLEKP